MLSAKLFMNFILCFFLAIILLQGVTPAHALTRSYTFELKNSSHTRLCTNKTMLTINGTSPGPTIYARRGDLVIVNVINNAGHNITIHWHGVKMPRYPWADGPEYVTQCPISNGTSFTQRVVLSDEEGTLWWHAHSEWSRNSVYGALIILPLVNESYPFPKPQAEVPILLGEWWNDDVQKVMEEFLISGGDPKISDAFLLNGLPGALYNCSGSGDTFKMNVESGKTYLIRMVNAVMNNIMFFKITNHTFTVVGSDGAYTKPLRSDYIAISPGQTVDFLLRADQPPNRYYMASRVYASGGTSDNTTTTGFLDYAGNYTPPASPQLPALPPINSTAASHNFTTQLRSLANSKYPADVPKNITRHLLFAVSINLRPCTTSSCAGPNNQSLLASVNNITFQLPKIAILQDYYRGTNGSGYTDNFPDNPPIAYNYTGSVPRELYDSIIGTAVSVLEFNSTVELVFQGTNIANGMDHPMHLHGHSFYVVGSGLGNFDSSTDPPNYNLLDPPLMETIAVPKNGWTAIRFTANNPGVWFMHCHFERHSSWGMGMAFIVKDGLRDDEKMLPPPPDMPRC